MSDTPCVRCGGIGTAMCRIIFADGTEHSSWEVRCPACVKDVDEDDADEQAREGT